MALDKKLGLIHMTSRQLTLVEKADCLSAIISSTLGGLDMVVGGKIARRVGYTTFAQQHQASFKWP
jgi:hypothetical protein